MYFRRKTPPGVLVNLPLTNHFRVLSSYRKVFKCSESRTHWISVRRKVNCWPRVARFCYWCRIGYYGSWEDCELPSLFCPERCTTIVWKCGTNLCFAKDEFMEVCQQMGWWKPLSFFLRNVYLNLLSWPHVGKWLCIVFQLLYHFKRTILLVYIYCASLPESYATTFCRRN